MFTSLTDPINYILLSLMGFIILYKSKAHLSYVFLLIIFSATPFLLNDVLFPADYMSDQFRYFDSVKAIRNFDFSKVDDSHSVLLSSYLLSIIPLPFVDTIQSLGFFNKFIFICLFAYLYTKKVLNNITILFFIFYPSLILYTGLSLRDTLILLFMGISLYFSIKGSFLKSFFWILPLVVLKPQNFLIHFIFIVFYNLLGIRRKGLTIKNILVSSFAAIAAWIAAAPLLLPVVNKYRIAMWQENGGHESEVTQITSAFDFISIGLRDSLYFLLKPFVWEAENALQLVQSIENLFVAFFMLVMTMKCYLHDKKRTLIWILYIFGSCLIYGLVVANFGTASRYRFPFIVTYIVFMMYDVIYGPMAKRKNFKNSPTSKFYASPTHSG